MIHCILKEDNFGEVSSLLCLGYLAASVANRGDTVKLLTQVDQVSKIPDAVWLWVSKEQYHMLSPNLYDFTRIEVVDKVPTCEFFRNRVEEVLASQKRGSVHPEGGNMRTDGFGRELEYEERFRLIPEKTVRVSMQDQDCNEDDDRQGLNEESKSPRQKGKHKGPRKMSK